MITVNKGFTLIEVIVSLLILAVVLGSSLRLFSSAIHSEQFVHDKTLANWVAHNYAVQQQFNGYWASLGAARSEVEMGNQQWVIETNTLSTQNEDVRKIDIKVYKDSDDQDHVTQLFAYSIKEISE